MSDCLVMMSHVKLVMMSHVRLMMMSDARLSGDGVLYQTVWWWCFMPDYGDDVPVSGLLLMVAHCPMLDCLVMMSYIQLSSNGVPCQTVWWWCPMSNHLMMVPLSGLLVIVAHWPMLLVRLVVMSHVTYSFTTFIHFLFDAHEKCEYLMNSVQPAWGPGDCLAWQKL